MAEYAPGRHAEVLTQWSLDQAPTVALPCDVVHPRGHLAHCELPDTFAYLQISLKQKENGVVFEKAVYQLRGQTVQGVTPVGDDEPRGQRGLQAGEEVAEDSVDVPSGQGVQARAEGNEL